MGTGNNAKKRKKKKKEEEEEHRDYDVDITSQYDSKEVLTSGNPEMDKKMGGGIPAGSLTLIEGPNDCGKSVLTQQLLWGGAQQGFDIALYTTENTIKSFLKQMASLALDISDFFVLGSLKIYPISSDETDSEGGPNFLDKIIHHLSEKPSEMVLIDSLTVFVTQTSHRDILNFFTACKKLCDTGKTILLTVHSYAFGEEMLTRVRSICDAHISLKLEEMGDKLIKTMEIAKIRGAQRTTGNIISFDVEPNFGLRIIPISRAKA
jgi:flagellar protein FlaH